MKRWTPGDPIPPRNSGHDPDALGALARSCAEAEPISRSRSARSRLFGPPRVSAELQAEYDYELTELAGRLLDGDVRQWEDDVHLEQKAVAEADAEAREAMGHPAVWEVVREMPRGAGDVRVARSTTVDLMCSRCESVGHVVESCPFSAFDADVLRIAEARRVRRRERAA